MSETDKSENNKITAKLDEQERATEKQNCWTLGFSCPFECLNQLQHSPMDGGGTDLPHPPLPFAHWGIVYIVRGCRAPTALIPCDFVSVGCSAMVGF